MPRMQRGLPVKRGVPACKRVVVVSSGKGGVGKSSVSVNLALALAALPGRPRIGLLDLDIFGPSIPKLMGLEGVGEPLLTSAIRSILEDNRLTPLRSHGIPCMSMGFLLPNSPSGSNNADTPVVWRGMMVMKAVQQLLFDVDWKAGGGGAGDLDVLVIDTPPGTGDVALSLGQLVHVDGAVIVSTPQDVAILDTRKGIAMFRKLAIPLIGAVLNMSHFIAPGTTTPHPIFGSPIAFRETCKELGLEVLAEVEISPTVSRRGDQGWPAVMMGDEEDEAIPRVRKEFSELAAKVWKSLESK
ncbi:ATP-binding protein involved in chromosome partitioning, partial [Phenoliferia sp. Uapishka_3]